MLTTPGGSSAWRSTSAKRSAESGVVSAGLRTTVLPVASAGAIFHESMSSGKFQGTIWPATPIGRGVRGPGESLLARGVDRRVGLARLEPLAADEVPVMVAKLNEVASLRRGRVVPAGRHGRTILLALELGHDEPFVREPLGRAPPP